MRKIDFKPNFKKDLSNIEIAGIEKVTSDYFEAGGYLSTYYTSSGSYAIVGANESLCFEYEDVRYFVGHFALTENNMLIIIGHHHDDYNEEDSCYFEIEPSDFD